MTQPKSFPRPGELQATNEAPRVVSPVQPTPYIPNPGVRALLANSPTPAVASPNSSNTSIQPRFYGNGYIGDKYSSPRREQLIY